LHLLFWLKTLLHLAPLRSGHQQLVHPCIHLQGRGNWGGGLGGATISNISEH
jgi:hypothetical protein